MTVELKTTITTWNLQPMFSWY